MQYLKALGIIANSCCENTEAIRKALVSAFFTQAAIRLEDGQYKTLLGNRVNPSELFRIVIAERNLDGSNTPVVSFIFQAAIVRCLQPTGITCSSVSH